MDRDETRETYGWASEQERAEAYAAIAERAAHNRSEELLASATARQSVGANTPTDEPAKRTGKERTMSSTTQWQSWITDQIKASRRVADKTMASAVAGVLGDIENKHREALDKLRTEVVALRNELTELRSEMKVRGSVDDLQARIGLIEQARPLRIGKAVAA